MKSAALNTGLAGFSDSFHSPLPVSRTPLDLFSDSDEEIAAHGTHTRLAELQRLFPDLDDDDDPPVSRESRHTASMLPESSDDDTRRFAVVDTPQDDPVIRLIPDRQEPAREPIREAPKPLLPPSLIRKIERELRENACDPKIVFQACRDLPRGSRKFEEAYANARVRAYLNQPRRPAVSDINPMPTQQWAFKEPAPAQIHNPMVVIHLGQLMRHFGLWVILLLAAQTWTSWKVGDFANRFLVGGMEFYFSSCLAFMLFLNAWVWFSRRGNLYSRFLAPGACLFVLAIVPGFILQLLGVLQTL